MDELLASNLSIQTESPSWLRELRALARSEAIAESEKFDDWCLKFGVRTEIQNRAATEQAVLARYWVVGGHQPELFHPGVWFKNFLLSGLSQMLSRNGNSCQALHVIIDHDLAKADAIKTLFEKDGKRILRNSVLPFRSADHPPLPWQSTYLDPSMLSKWIDVKTVVEQDCVSQGWEPLLSQHFSILEKCILNSVSVSDAFTLFRRSIELACGIENREVRMSQLCEGFAFGEFFFRCLSASTKLVDAYNQSRNEFRQRRKIRNAAQPVPELQFEAGWQEMPFWVYRSRRPNSKVEQDNYRSKLWFSQSKQGRFIANSPSHGASLLLRVPDSIDFAENKSSIHDIWKEWNRQGICIRPRALMTTFFLRYVLSDLFVHGVGGGLYDSVTDEIAVRLWGLTPPKMIVASATLHLPVVEPVAAAEVDEGKLRKHLRWLRSSPERFLDVSSPSAKNLLEQHQSLVANIPDGQGKADWHRQMASLRSRIHDSIRTESVLIESASNQLIQQRQQKSLAASREYSFAVFSESDITSRLKKVVSKAIGTTSDVVGK